MSQRYELPQLLDIEIDRLRSLMSLYPHLTNRK